MGQDIVRVHVSGYCEGDCVRILSGCMCQDTVRVIVSGYCEGAWDRIL